MYIEIVIIVCVILVLRNKCEALLYFSSKSDCLLLVPHIPCRVIWLMSKRTSMCLEVLTLTSYFNIKIVILFHSAD